MLKTCQIKKQFPEDFPSVSKILPKQTENYFLYKADTMMRPKSYWVMKNLKNRIFIGFPFVPKIL